ncbi:MAG TPA: DUF4377 domain-containing protein [Chitinophaga sp.]|uniref:DUF4377 domain-containing protein n=1 Tax=Chitinophaga sp. TaxID=1869181 RepID=UPI002B6F8BE5|nr:DUF4377 domain-containing protein [Chitinophaga sp.]HVI43659.1 DUF4377 domain-containing protein [Chitinophaga sp.]
MFLELALSLVTAFTTPVQKKQTPKTQTIYIKESKEPCTGVAPMECLQIKGIKDSAWSNFYTNIEGFKYTPGYRYKLVVRITTIKNPPADGSSLKYTLKKILEKKKINTAATDNKRQWTFIASKKWGLIKMEDKVLSDSKIWIEFDPAAKRFYGKGGCNSISGGYDTSGDLLTFKMAISTKMACMEEGIMKRESEFLNHITEQTFRYDVADQTLNLYRDGKIILMFGMQEKGK